uniref:ShKT domain-containing protein n=1 Tax=Parastrongyloides trichosuri TaxID=131310 RepID=A0A0N4ZVS8_PARTI
MILIFILINIIVTLSSYVNAAVGDACTTKADCGTGFSCVVLLSILGITTECVTSCTTDSDCNGGTCAANPSGDGTDATDLMCSTIVNPLTQTCVTGLSIECTGNENTCNQYDVSCQLAKLTEACTIDANCVTGLSCVSLTCQVVVDTTTTTASETTTTISGDTSGTTTTLLDTSTTTLSSTTIIDITTTSDIIAVQTTTDNNIIPQSTTTIGNIVYCNETSNNVAPKCEDKVVGGNNDCPSLSYLCTDIFYHDLMREKCPRTCNYCDEKLLIPSNNSSSICEDKIVGGPNDCPSLSYLLLYSTKIDAGDTIVCSKGGGECTGTTKCMQLGANLACVEQCTVADAATQCGTGVTCTAGTDVDGATSNTCATAQGCLTDAECSGADATKPICNLYTLQCEAQPTTTTVVTTTTTVSTTSGSTTDISTTTTDSSAVTTTTQGNVVIITSKPCEDKVVGGSNDCQALSVYCNDNIYRDLMKDKCPRTCGYCDNNTSGNSGSNTCKNKLSECSIKSYLCKVSAYKVFMKTNCPATCGYC